jgi:hypothetical protein
VKKLHQDKLPVTHIATNLKCGDTQEETIKWVKSIAECVMTNLCESVGEGDELCYPFEDAFRVDASQCLLTFLEIDGFLKLRDVGIEIGTTRSLDEFCIDDFIYDAVFYCFGLPEELLLGPKEQ